MTGSDLGKAVGGFFVVLMLAAAFGVFALAGGIGMALWSIWLPITVPQALVVIGLFGAFGPGLLLVSWLVNR